MTNSCTDRPDGWLASPADATSELERDLFRKLVEPNAGSIILYEAGFMGTQAPVALRSVDLAPLAFSDDRTDRQIDGGRLETVCYAVQKTRILPEIVS
jgi:hypothetical protein